MNFSVSNLIAGFVFGVFGLVYIKYGKREANMKLVGVGVGLCAFPYFVENPYLVWGIGISLIVYAYKFC